MNHTDRRCKITTRIRKTLKGRRGATILELVVSFALLGILLIVASAALGSAFSIYNRVMSVNRANSVAEILIEELTAEISMMSSVGEQTIDVNGEVVSVCDKYGIAQYGNDENFNYLTYINENGHPVVLTASSFAYIGTDMSGGIATQVLSSKTVDDGLLHVYYKAVTVESEEGEETGYGEIDWHYDEKMYFGNKITKLKFEYADIDRVYKVEIELTNQLTGYVYSSYRYIKCYNLPKTI